MTPTETDAMTDHELETPPTIRERIRAWIAFPANVTRGWLLFVCMVAFLFVGMALYAAVQVALLDNRVTAEKVANSIAQQVATCTAGNETRADARTIATSAVDADQQAVESDRAVWKAVDESIPGGLPDAIRAALAGGFDLRDANLAARQTLIETTYAPRDCAQLARDLTGEESPSSSEVSG